ncbi:hypothetical protein RS865_06535, partial [Bifidobacterium longum]|nr:hypothetical protein [Bifidobacterium longum]
MAARNDDGLYAKARSLFISKATMDDLTGRATPRQTDAASRPFDTEPANGERSKRERLLRRARFPVVKSLDGYDFSNVRLPDGYALDGLLDLDFVPCVCSIESGPCERVDVFHVSGRFWSTSACGEKRTPARPAWT